VRRSKRSCVSDWSVAGRRVDLTFSDAMLMIDGVRLERGVWVVDAVYGTTNLFLSAVPAR